MRCVGDARGNDDGNSGVDTATVTIDLYRDIHKGIRAELFAVTGAAGSVDPADRAARAALAERVMNITDILVGHAEHEDAHIQPLLEVHLPELAAKVETDHVELEARMVFLNELAAATADAPLAAQPGASFADAGLTTNTVEP